MKKPILVLIRDGWGYRKNPELNAPVKGKTPYTDYLMTEYPNTIIDAVGEAVGLPKGYQGNSEVGHLTIGAGRIMYQSMVRINKAIENGEFFKNIEFLAAIKNARDKGTKLHIIGLLQKEGVHAHIDHAMALLDLCAKEDFHDVVFHIITDGRDAPPKSSIESVKLLVKKLKDLGIGKIGTLSGRYYAMDRDKRWDRTKKTYDAVVLARSDKPAFTDVIEEIQSCYDADETDEFIVPRIAHGYEGVKDGDSFIFYNFRIDRPRQLTQAMVEKSFDAWECKPLDIYFVAMTDFYSPMNGHVAFGKTSLDNLLGKVLSENGKRQLRISETEKYAHVTFFFNGQNEEPDKGEDRVLIPSPKVSTYDLKPEMSVYEIADRLVKEIDKDVYDVIITNFVNGDMVGHTGIWKAIVTAVEAVDASVKKVLEKVLEKDGVALVFADHGNCEDVTEAWRTSHTLNPVPFILVSNTYKDAKLKEGKGLRDIAPTVLSLLDIKKPEEMTGENIIQ